MAKMMDLKEDPELKPIFDDIEANGAAAMEKYWNDTDLMSKISQKMSAMKLGPATPPRKQENMKVLPLLSSVFMHLKLPRTWLVQQCMHTRNVSFS